MASLSGTSGSSAVVGGAGEDGLAYAVRGCGNPAHTDASGVVNRIQDRWSSGDDSLLADAFRPEWPYGGWIFDQDRFDWRYIAGRGNQVVMQILALARKEFFHQSHPKSLS